MEVPSGILSVGLQSPMVSSALASWCTSYRATCPRSWTSEPSNFRTSTGVDACAGFAALRTSARLMDAHFEASFSECRATPTSNDTFRSRVSPSGSWPLRHEIHLQDLPDLARANAPNCHEQFLLVLELGSVTENFSDQRHTASWVMYDLLHQTFLVTVALYT